MDINIESLFNKKPLEWEKFIPYLKNIIEGKRVLGDVQSLFIQIRPKSEFGEDTSSETAYRSISDELSSYVDSLSIDICRIIEVNDYYVVVGVKL